MQPQITIVMATYEGARFLRPQIDSIMGQTHRNWRLIVSDDGSRDETRQIVSEYAGKLAPGRIALIDGPGRGATANFLHLIGQVDPDGWIAFCDQDDVWRPDKLARGAEWLATRKGPAVYAARTTICDEELRELAPAPHFSGPFGFRNALVQACLPGNTTIANAEALGLLQSAAPTADAAGIISHDWWVYQLLSGAGAQICRDQAQVLLYRQHPRNVMGRNDTTKAKAARFSMLFDRTFADWLERNQLALEGAQVLLLPENRRLLHRFGTMIRAPGASAFLRAVSMRLYRQNHSGTAAVLAAAMAGRLRAPRAGRKAGQAGT